MVGALVFVTAGVPLGCLGVELAGQETPMCRASGLLLVGMGLAALWAAQVLAERE